MTRPVSSDAGRTRAFEDGLRSSLTLVIDGFLLLPIGIAAGLAWANLAPEGYFRFAHALRFAVNDVGMALFLGLVAEEVLEAFMPGGALFRWRRTLLPLVAATGGALGATAIYLAYLSVWSEFQLLDGWPVAAAQDLALAYFIARTVFPGRRGPMTFLLVVAAASDALAVATIAIYHPMTRDAVPKAAALMAAALLCAALLRAAGLRKIWIYLVTSGALSWAAFYSAGMQPALALVPIVPFLPHRPRHVGLSRAAQRETPRRFERIFRYPVQVVLGLYGLVNGGVVLGGEMHGAWAVFVSAVIGRPAGMLLAIGLAVAAGLRLPVRLHWREVVVVCFAASAGFTFALFVAASLIPAGPLANELKLGALSTGASAVVAVVIARLLQVGRFEQAHPPRPQSVHSPTTRLAAR
jgi:NhaA family Na+:H+ antiporter